MTTLLTSRLRLRPWRAEDRAPFAALNADPEVMRYFPAPLDRARSDAMVDRLVAHLGEHGWGFWALEVLETGRFAGFVGLNPVPESIRAMTAGAPTTEVGWRLARWSWGHGYATEAARAAVSHGFDVLGLPEIVSFTAATNLRSRAVMERLGMTRAPGDDFEHPAIPDGPLRSHVLYRLTR